MSSSVPPSFPPPNQAPLPPGKKPNILLWILGGFVVLMIGVTAMCGLGGFFLMRRATLDEVGGYAGVRSEVIEDVRLAEIMKHHGWLIGLAPGEKE